MFLSSSVLGQVLPFPTVAGDKFLTVEQSILLCAEDNNAKLCEDIKFIFKPAARENLMLSLSMSG